MYNGINRALSFSGKSDADGFKAKLTISRMMKDKFSCQISLKINFIVSANNTLPVYTIDVLQHLVFEL